MLEILQLQGRFCSKRFEALMDEDGGGECNAWLWCLAYTDVWLFWCKNEICVQSKGWRRVPCWRFGRMNGRDAARPLRTRYKPTFPDNLGSDNNDTAPNMLE